MEESQRSAAGGGYQAVMVEAPTQTVAVKGNGASAHAEVGLWAIDRDWQCRCCCD